jgi:hypothetical protein
MDLFNHVSRASALRGSLCLVPSRGDMGVTTMSKSTGERYAPLQRSGVGWILEFTYLRRNTRVCAVSKIVFFSSFTPAFRLFFVHFSLII